MRLVIPPSYNQPSGSPSGGSMPRPLFLCATSIFRILLGNKLSNWEIPPYRIRTLMAQDIHGGIIPAQP